MCEREFKREREIMRESQRERMREREREREKEREQNDLVSEIASHQLIRTVKFCLFVCTACFSNKVAKRH